MTEKHSNSKFHKHSSTKTARNTQRTDKSNSRNANNNKIILKSQCKGIAACSVRRAPTTKRQNAANEQREIYREKERLYEIRYSYERWTYMYIGVQDKLKYTVCCWRRSNQAAAVAMNFIERNPNKPFCCSTVRCCTCHCYCCCCPWCCTLHTPQYRHWDHKFYVAFHIENVQRTHFPTRIFEYKIPR